MKTLNIYGLHRGRDDPRVQLAPNYRDLPVHWRWHPGLGYWDVVTEQAAKDEARSLKETARRNAAKEDVRE